MLKDLDPMAKDNQISESANSTMTQRIIETSTMVFIINNRTTNFVTLDFRSARETS